MPPKRFNMLGKKSPKTPKAPIPPLDDPPPPPLQPPSVNIGTEPVDSTALPKLPTVKSGESLSSLTTDLSASTIHIREFSPSGADVSGGGGGLGLFIGTYSANASTSVSPIEIERARSPLFDFVRSRDPSPEPIDSGHDLPPEHLRPSSRWWQHAVGKEKKTRPWRNVSHSPRRKRPKSITSESPINSASSSPPNKSNAYLMKQSPPHPNRFIVPLEQEAAYAKTAKAVAKATGRDIWDGTKVVTYDIASAGKELLRLVPIPGVSEAVECLVRMWEFIGQVESNRMACLHLAERCAGILSSVQEEVRIAGPDVSATLADPMQSLITTFLSIEVLVQKLSERPFIKRYLKREEIQLQILEAHEKLTDDLQLFGLAIQVRILKELKEHDAHSPRLAHDDLAQTTIGASPPLPAIPPLPPPSYASPRSVSTQLPLVTEEQQPVSSTQVLDQAAASAAASTISSFVLPDIAAHHHDRFAEDCQFDNADLRRLIKEAMDANSDDRLIEILQVQRPEMAEAIRTLRRALEDPHLSNPNVRRGSTTSSMGSDNQSTQATKSIHSLPVEENPDELKVHREFIEEEIEALRRSSGDGHDLPPNMMDVVDHHSMGDRSDTTDWSGIFQRGIQGSMERRNSRYQGALPNHPKDLFLHEAQIWQALKHPNILRLRGASSTTSDPPWFFVSPYMRNGSVVKYLKAHPRQANHLQMIHEIAIGMEYLHSQNVLHGDLKAVNVLVDDDLHCVISDFGQSKLKTEVYRISHTSAPGGTLRWKAPELIQDSFAPITWQADVYAFAICCTEILMDGALPWPNLDDPVIHELVRSKDQRPNFPCDGIAPELITLIRRCWARAAVDRPTFQQISSETANILEHSSEVQETTPRPPLRPEIEAESDEEEVHDGARSPSLEPAKGFEPISGASPYDDTEPNPSPNEPSPMSSDSERSFKSMLDSVYSTASTTGIGGGSAKLHEPSGNTPINSPLARSVITTRRPPSIDDGYESPVPQDEAAAEKRNEVRYRDYLTHPYNVSLNLPLWTPSEIKIGDVGYHKRPQGSFVRLFNAFDPVGTTTAHWHGKHTPLPPLLGVQTGSQSKESRNVVQRGLEWVGGFLKFPTPRTLSSPSSSGSGSPATPAPLAPGLEREVSRKYDFVLHAKQKRSLIVAESTVYRYVTDLTLGIAKEWFAEHREAILDTYGRRHHLVKEDLLLVIGTLDTKDYALFVNHKHPAGMAHFNIYSERREGEPFGVWTTDTQVVDRGGPKYIETGLDDAPRLSANKVSIVRAEPAPLHTLVIARLRFKPDSDQPTSL